MIRLPAEPGTGGRRGEEEEGGQDGEERKKGHEEGGPQAHARSPESGFDAQEVGPEEGRQESSSEEDREESGAEEGGFRHSGAREGGSRQDEGRERRASQGVGPRKGGEPRTMAHLITLLRDVGVFQLHRNVTPGAANTEPGRIANVDEACKAQLIGLRVEPQGGRFVVSIPSRFIDRDFSAK